MIMTLMNPSKVARDKNAQNLWTCTPGKICYPPKLPCNREFSLVGFHHSITIKSVDLSSSLVSGMPPEWSLPGWKRMEILNRKAWVRFGLEFVIVVETMDSSGDGCSSLESRVCLCFVGPAANVNQQGRVDIIQHRAGEPSSLLCWINRESCWRPSAGRWLGEISREGEIAPIQTNPDLPPSLLVA